MRFGEVALLYISRDPRPSGLIVLRAELMTLDMNF